MEKRLQIARDALNKIIDNPNCARSLAQFAVTVLNTLEPEGYVAPVCHLPVDGKYEIRIEPTSERIWVIKQLRTFYPGLSLLEAKNATDPLVHSTYPQAVYVYMEDLNRADGLCLALNQRGKIAFVNDKGEWR